MMIKNINGLVILYAEENNTNLLTKGGVFTLPSKLKLNIIREW